MMADFAFSDALWLKPRWMASLRRSMRLSLPRYSSQYMTPRHSMQRYVPPFFDGGVCQVPQLGHRCSPGCRGGVEIFRSKFFFCKKFLVVVWSFLYGEACAPSVAAVQRSN